MTTKLYDVLDALLPAALIATIAGTCFSGADYIAMLSAEHYAELLGWFPLGWQNANGVTLDVVVAVVALPVTGFVAWWAFRTARRAQRDSRRIR